MQVYITQLLTYYYNMFTFLNVGFSVSELYILIQF